MKRTGSNRMQLISASLVMACFVGAMACNQQTPAEEETEAAIEASEEIQDSDIEYDAEFAQDMAESNLLDIQLGELAQAKAASKEIKTLAAKIIDTHKSANKELKNWASSNGFTLPDEMSEKDYDFYQEMAAYDGTDFDEAYSDYLVTDHKQEIRKLERESTKGNDPELKQWASEKIPVWQTHLDMAQQAENTADEKDE